MKELESLTPNEFEELIATLLRRERFENVEWTGAHGLDRGCDIRCEMRVSIGTKSFQSICVVQCKHYVSRRPSVSSIDKDLSKVKGIQPHWFILVTSSTLTASTRDWFYGRDSPEMRLVLWERGDIERLLERHQEVRYRFLGVPFDQSFPRLEDLQRANPRLALLKDVSLSSVVRAVIRGAAVVASQREQVIATPHLLYSLAEYSQFFQSILGSVGIPPEDLMRFLESEILSSLEVEESGDVLVATESFAFALLGAERMAVQTQRHATVTDACVLLSVLLGQRGETITFLANWLPLGDLLKAAEKHYQDILVSQGMRFQLENFTPPARVNTFKWSSGGLPVIPGRPLINRESVREQDDPSQRNVVEDERSGGEDIRGRSQELVSDATEDSGEVEDPQIDQLVESLWSDATGQYEPVSEPASRDSVSPIPGSAVSGGAKQAQSEIVFKLVDEHSSVGRGTETSLAGEESPAEVDLPVVEELIENYSELRPLRGAAVEVGVLGALGDACRLASEKCQLVSVPSLIYCLLRRTDLLSTPLSLAGSSTHELLTHLWRFVIPAVPTLTGTETNKPSAELVEVLLGSLVPAPSLQRFMVTSSSVFMSFFEWDRPTALRTIAPRQPEVLNKVIGALHEIHDQLLASIEELSLPTRFVSVPGDANAEDGGLQVGIETNVMGLLPSTSANNTALVSVLNAQLAARDSALQLLLEKCTELTASDGMLVVRVHREASVVEAALNRSDSNRLFSDLIRTVFGESWSWRIDRTSGLLVGPN